MNRQDTDSRFKDLYERYFQSIVSYLVRLGFSRDEARDLAQETFQRVYRAMGQYRGDSEWGFLQTTARRLAFNELRARRTLKRAGAEVPLEEVAFFAEPLATAQERASPEAELIEQEEGERRRKWLYGAIKELPEILQPCLLLWLGGLKYRQIEKTLGISLDTVKTRLHEARKRLRAQWAEEPDAIAWLAAPGEDDHDQER